MCDAQLMMQTNASNVVYDGYSTGGNSGAGEIYPSPLIT